MSLCVTSAVCSCSKQFWGTILLLVSMCVVFHYFLVLLIGIINNKIGDFENEISISFACWVWRRLTSTTRKTTSSSLTKVYCKSNPAQTNIGKDGVKCSCKTIIQWWLVSILEGRMDSIVCIYSGAAIEPVGGDAESSPFLWSCRGPALFGDLKEGKFRENFKLSG